MSQYFRDRYQGAGAIAAAAPAPRSAPAPVVGRLRRGLGAAPTPLPTARTPRFRKLGRLEEPPQGPTTVEPPTFRPPSGPTFPVITQFDSGSLRGGVKPVAPTGPGGLTAGGRGGPNVVIGGGGGNIGTNVTPADLSVPTPPSNGGAVRPRPTAPSTPTQPLPPTTTTTTTTTTTQPGAPTQPTRPTRPPPAPVVIVVGAPSSSKVVAPVMPRSRPVAPPPLDVDADLNALTQVTTAPTVVATERKVPWFWIGLGALAVAAILTSDRRDS